ncbi:MAG: hypothetical protein GYB65_02310 [Chloroflexi bacterium]|nr:hypothetical protein [Chloroflexota bacterium]
MSSTPFSVEKLPDEPIVVCSMTTNFDLHNDYPAFWAALGSALEGLEAPIYRITELLFDDMEFSDMAVALAAEAKSGMPGSAGDPRIRFVLVSVDGFAQMAVDSVGQDQYGQLDVPLFGTVEDALAYVREQLAT